MRRFRIRESEANGDVGGACLLHNRVEYLAGGVDVVPFDLELLHRSIAGDGLTGWCVDRPDPVAGAVEILVSCWNSFNAGNQLRRLRGQGTLRGGRSGLVRFDPARGDR